MWSPGGPRPPHLCGFRPLSSRDGDSHDRSPIDPPAAAADASPELRVLRQFRVVFNGINTHFQQVGKRAGPGGAQAWALSQM